MSQAGGLEDRAREFTKRGARQYTVAKVIYIPRFVLGELHFGFRKGSRFKSNLSSLNGFLSKSSVRKWLPTMETVKIYGATKDVLQLRGNPIPENDIWIASQCFENGSRLVTFDAHFRRAPGLSLSDF